MSAFACAGNALLDINAFVSQNFVRSHGFEPGGTFHIEYNELLHLLEKLPDGTRTAGGGAANTARVFRSLGQNSSFAGALGQDAEAVYYNNDLAEAGVRLYTMQQTGHTGIFCALIDQYGQRTIIVSPGVAAKVSAALLPAEFFTASTVFHIDGFLAADPDNFGLLIRRAHAAGLRISFDVGGRRVTEANRLLFMELIHDYCDWVFLNEDEFHALREGKLDASLVDLADELACDIIVKRAQNGAVAVCGGDLLESPVRAINPLDATGAGDAFAAGYLTAVLQDFPAARALRFANRVAEHAIQVPGMRIDTKLLAGLPATIL